MSEETEEQPANNEQKQEVQTWDESSAGENIIVDDEPETTNLPSEASAKEGDKPETKNMDTHAQHLHHAPGKRFRHYLYEFLMLFLAVFCGFLAENFREERVENHREENFMRSMIEDLQTDTAAIREKYDLGNIIRMKSDTLVTMINNAVNDSNILAVYRLSIETGRVVHTQFENRTSNQLKTSGMRLIRNKTVADSIRYYWNSIENLDGISSRLEVLLIKGADLAGKLFNSKYISRRITDNPLEGQVIISPAAKLITGDEKLLAEYANLKRSRENVLLIYLFRLKYSKAKAIGLMNLIKKEYHLE